MNLAMCHFLIMLIKLISKCQLYPKSNQLVGEIYQVILEGLVEVWVTVLAKFCTQTFHLVKLISIFSSN